MPYYRCPGCGVTVHSAAAFSSARVCPDCSTALPRSARIYPTPAGAREIRRVLAARPEAVAKARHALLALPVTTDTRSKLELLVSELVANSVLHAGLDPDDPVSVYISGDTKRVRISVRDGGPGFEAPARADGEMLTANGRSLEPGGRGCVIVDALADAWGVDAAFGGCTVWAEVAVDDHPREVADRAGTVDYVSS